jgi:hypothetical protein
VVETAALLLCDRAERDERSGKWTLHGLFDVVWAASFPAVHDRLDAYLRLRLDEAGADTSRQLFFVCRSPSGAERRSAARPLAPSAFRTAEAVCRFEGIPFEAPGPYVIEAWLDDEMIGSATLTVAERRPPGQPLH